ncbi:MAG: glycosyltransferase family 4 protein [Solirubrobacteraceae bacterium]
MILFLHHRYRHTGGEEPAVDDLLWLVHEHLGEDAQLVGRDSAALSPVRAAAGLLGGGLHPEQVAGAVRRTGARIVHAHNLQPTFGWRALAAAREAGAAVVCHLHQYRLVCAASVCFRDGHDCTNCHGANTLPGVIHNCRGSRAEAVTYAAALSLWQRRLAANVDAFVVPSEAALRRLQDLGAPVTEAFIVPHVSRHLAGAADHPGGQAAGAQRGHALFAARLVPEKGLAVAIEACRLAGLPLVVAGEGPERARLEGRGDGVRFVGHVDLERLRELRAGSVVALAPSLAAETFGLAAAEAMAAGVPVAASRIGALPELVPEPWLAQPGDPDSLAAAIRRILADPEAPSLALRRARDLTAPEVVAPALAAVYDEAVAQARRRRG